LPEAPRGGLLVLKRMPSTQAWQFPRKTTVNNGCFAKFISPARAGPDKTIGFFDKLIGVAYYNCSRIPRHCD